MLKIISSTSQLNIEEILEVYREDILENAKRLFPRLNEVEQVRKAEDSFLSYLQDDFFCQRDSFYAFWVVGGRYRAALRMEPYSDGLLLEALSTAPNARRNGYGYMLVSEILKYLSSSAYNIVYSHISKKNHPSLNLHKKCGFQLYTDFAKLIDGTVTQNSCTMYYRLKK